MPNVLIVTAHPVRQSFNFALTEQAMADFNQHGWQVVTSELNQMDFEASMSHHDYPELPSTLPAALLQKQATATEQNLWCPSIANEQQKLLDADWVILQFPLWWGSFPAILKGWIERVCSYGFAYGSQKQLAGKRITLSVTTGGAADASERQYYLNKVNGMANEVFGYMAMTIETPFLAHGPASATLEQRQQMLYDYQQHLRLLNSI